MKIKSSKILVIGDVMIDRYIIGHHNRNSPEANCAILDYTGTEDRLGGAANVAYNLSQLNQKVSLISVTGDDQAATILSDMCKSNNINLHKIIDAKRPTTIKTRYVNESYNQYLRVDQEIRQNINAQIESEFIDKVKKISTEGIELIIIQDYNKGVITEKVIKNIQAICSDMNIILSVDPKHNNFHTLSECDLFKPNLKELEHQYGDKIVTSKDAIYKAIKKLGLNKSKSIFVTLAAKGMYYQKGDEYGVIEGISLPNADVSGAGDTVISVLSILLLEGTKCHKMAAISNKCGANVCKKQGVSFVNMTDFQSFIYEETVH